MDVTPEGWGNVEINGDIPCNYPSEAFIFESGEEIVIEAVPQTGYHFAGWEGEPTINERDNPLEIEIDNNMALTATFAPDFYEYASNDGKVTIAIADGTDVEDGSGEPVSEIEFTADAAPPPLPAQTALAGQVYYVAPDGTTFDPEARLIWSYNPETLPEGTNAEDLVITYYDEGDSEWTLLKCDVDTENNLVTAEIDHLSTFAILIPLPLVAPPPEALFTSSALTISPATVGSGGTVSISVTIANNGGMEGSIVVPLKINGEVENTSDLTLAAATSQTVTFTTSRDAEGDYEVNVNGLTGSFTVDSTMVTSIQPENFSNDAPEPEEQDSGGGINWLIATPIIVAVFLAVFLPIKLKKKHYEW